MNRILLRTILAVVTLFVLSCKEELPDDGKKESEKDKTETSIIKGQPIAVVDGKVRFFIGRAEGNPRAAMGLPTTDFSGLSVRINSKDYPLVKGADGEWYCDADASAGNSYSAVLVGAKSSRWYGSSAYKDVKVPYSQILGTTLPAMKDYPQYAEYSEATGNVLPFNDGFALLDLSVTTTVPMVSVKVRSLSGEMIAGTAAFLPSKGQFQVSDGLDFAVLNCTGAADSQRTGSPVHLCLPLLPASLSRGLEITLCDREHRMMRMETGPLDLKGGAVTPVSVNYRPDEDLLWYEGFDNFVWGGNLMAGSAGTGYAPDGKKIGISDGADRDGYADAYEKVAYDVPGTGFIQSNTWTDVSGKGVGASHVMSDSYIMSRGVGDWMYLFRCQEYQGFVAVGTGNGGRGILQTPSIGTLEGMATVTVSFDFCFQNGVTDDLLFQIMNGGMIRNCRIDGQDAGIVPSFVGVAGSAVIPSRKLTIPGSLAEPKTWHHAEVTVDRATDGTALYFAGNETTSGVHGFWLDNLTVRKDRAAERKGNLRVLYWNIQNGMWSDQANSYANFVKWVKKYDPDICVWCEAASIYKDNTNTSSSSRFLPDGWATLAARYGHSYSALSGKRDNYPQEITSKYPIRTLLKITDTDVAGKPVSHGAAIQQVDVNGRQINFVTCHMWPQGYGFGVSGDAAREASKAAHEGDYYRQFEMQYIVAHTVNDPKYASCQDWILLGDLNSRSRKDNWYYGYPEDDTLLLTQDVVLQRTNLLDIIAESWPGAFCSSTYGNARIDFMYASPSMMGRVVDAGILVDKWTVNRPSKYVSSFYDPSDHRPILVDFDLSK